MFVIEWLFDKMGYTKKIEWTSSALLWEDVEKAKPTKKKAVAKKTVRKTIRAKKA